MNYNWRILVFIFIFSTVDYQHIEGVQDLECVEAGGMCRHPNDCGGYTDKHLCSIQKILQNFVCCFGPYQEDACENRGGSCQERRKCERAILEGDLCPKQKSDDVVCCQGTYKDRVCAKQGGTCRYGNECVGNTVESQCSNKSKVCCIDAIPQEETCEIAGGLCLHKRVCTGYIKTGLCSDETDNIRCCIGSYQEPSCKERRGTCVDKQDCAGHTEPRLCPRQIGSILCCFGPYQEKACSYEGGTCRNRSDCAAEPIKGNSSQSLCPRQSEENDIVCCPERDRKVYQTQNGQCFINKCKHENGTYCGTQTVVCPSQRSLTTRSRGSEIFEDLNGSCYYIMCEHFTGKCQTHYIPCRSLLCYLIANIFGLDKQMECAEVYLRTLVAVVIAIILLFLKQTVIFCLKYVMNLGLRKFFPERRENNQERIRMKSLRDVEAHDKGTQLSWIMSDGIMDVTDIDDFQAENKPIED